LAKRAAAEFRPERISGISLTLNRGDEVKAEPISVGQVLSEKHRFVVPIYQRSYTWTEKKQLEPLFTRIEAKAQERLQKDRVDFPHYMALFS
jgi:hypothetical protein